MSVRCVLCGLALIASVAWGGCAEGLDAGERSGSVCETDDDCNATSACGARRLCVAGRCEGNAPTNDASGSVLVPCGTAAADDDDAGG